MNGIKTAIKNLLAGVGYEIRRKPENHADILAAYGINPAGHYWGEWISKAPDRFVDIYKRNRKVQQDVNVWLTDSIYRNSLWQYGVPGGPDALARIEKNITYTDLIAFLSLFLEEVRYLEIGVSAGKNFFQLANQFDHTVLYGMDIEDINPVLAEKFSETELVWESEKTFPFVNHKGESVEKRFSMTRYQYEKKQNSIYYVSGDKFRPDLWKQIAGTRFSLVFSDACHIPESIETELDYLVAYDLINPNEFIMVWDDLYPRQIPSFLKNVSTLQKRFNSMAPCAAIYNLHGSYGSNAETGGLHSVGVFVYNRHLEPVQPGVNGF